MMQNKLEVNHQTPSLFYVPNELDLPANFTKRYHDPFSHTYQCSNEELWVLLRESNQKLKGIDEDLMRYLKDGGQLFDEFRDTIAKIGKSFV
jgi:hypothetical protein